MVAEHLEAEMMSVRSHRRALTAQHFIGRRCTMALAVLAFLGGAPAAFAGEAPPTLAILPFEIEDTSGETGPPDRHDAMLARVTAIAAEEISRRGLFTVVPQEKVAAAVASVNSGTHLRRCNGCELDIAKRSGARYVLVGWIYKVSTLILTLHIDVKDAATGKPVYARVFDFRGDNEKAYAHAARTMARSIEETMRRKPREFGDAAAKKIKIAVFDFELEDKSAGGGIVAEDERDRRYLDEATDEAKRLLESSGRYHIVDSRDAELDEAAHKFGIRHCRGCEAAATRKLGADEAMIGVITRVNRTEHTLLIRLVDAHTGDVISTSFTDLRLGANYAWPRSVKSLMTSRVLAQHECDASNSLARCLQRR
jgi:hypothetical protein